MKKGLIFSAEQILIFGSGTSNLQYIAQDTGGMSNSFAVVLSGHSNEDLTINDCFRFYLTSLIGNPEPADGYRTKATLNIQGFFLPAPINYSLETFDNYTQYGITWWNFNLYLKEPKIYTYINNEGKLVAMLEVRGKKIIFNSSVEELNFIIEDNEYYQISRVFYSPTSIPLLGEFLYHSNFVGYGYKGIFTGETNFSNICNFGYRYLINGVWYDLPVKNIYEKPYNNSNYPKFNALRTNDARSEVAGKASQNYAETSYIECLLYPNVKNNILRHTKDNNSIVLRTSMPRVIIAKWRQTPETGDAIEYIERRTLLNKEGFLLTVLEDESDKELENGIERPLNNDFYIPFFANFTFGGIDVGAHQYNSMVEVENHLDSGMDWYDPSNAIFSQLYTPNNQGIKPYVIDQFPLYLDPRSLFQFMLYYPPDIDSNHWKLGIPLRKANSEDYWQKVRTQYIYHLQLPISLQKKRRNYIVDTGLNTPLSEALNKNALDKAFLNPNLYYANIPFTYLGINKPVIDTWYYGVNERLSDISDRYNLTNASSVSSSSIKMELEPSSTTVEIEYELGSFEDYPYLYDLFCDRIKWNLEGSNINNIKVYGIAFNNDELLLYDGSNLEGSINKSFDEDDNYAGSWAQDFTAGYIDPTEGIYREFDNGKDITVDDLEGVSSSVMANNKGNINFSLFCSGNIRKIKFIISLDNTNNFDFYYLKFSNSSYPSVSRIIETPNQFLIFNNKKYFRFGMLNYFGNEDEEDPREIPEVYKPHQRVNLIDYLCFRMNFIDSEIVDINILNDEVRNYFDMDELYPYDFVDGVKNYDDDISYLNNNLSTAIPIVNKSSLSSNDIKFALINYLREVPPIPTLPGHYYNENFILSSDVNNRNLILINPYKKYYFNPKGNIFLTKDNINQSTVSVDYATRHNITDADIRYENDEVMKKWDGTEVEEYYITHQSKNIATVTPFWGYTGNINPTVDEEGVIKIYQTYFDSSHNDRVIFLGYDGVNYYKGFYNFNTGIYEKNNLLDKDESIPTEFFEYNTYFKLDEGTNYMQVVRSNNHKHVDLGGRHPIILNTEQTNFISVGGSNYKLYKIKFDGLYITEEDTIELIETFPTDISFSQLCMDEFHSNKNTCLLAYNYNNDTIIKLFNEEGILDDYALSFKEEFGVDKEFSYAYVQSSISTNMIWVNSYCNDGKLYFVGLEGNLNKIVTFSLELPNIVQFYHPFIIRQRILLACNTIKGVRWYDLTGLFEDAIAY